MSYNPYRPFTSYWWKYWLHLPYDIKWFFKRIYIYRHFLWEDNDYDFASILHIMRFKLRRLRDHLDQHGHLAHKEDRVAELARVDVLLRNVVEEDPDDEWSMHHSQWHHNKDLNDPCPESEEACHKACFDGMEREQRNWHELWKYIDEHMRGWWDIFLLMIGVGFYGPL